MECQYEHVCDLDAWISLFRCSQCGRTQKVTDQPTNTECQIDQVEKQKHAKTQ
jgi:hypothetical protein